MATYDEIQNSEVDAESPITESLATRWRDNPEAVHEGHSSVPADKRIRVPEALRTDELDVRRYLGPDGAGGMRFKGGASFAGVELDGDIAAIIPGGVWHADNVAIVSAQAPSTPLIIYCNSDFSISALGSIVSSYPVMIRAAGNVTLDGPITAPFVDIRCGGTFTNAGLGVVNCHGTKAFAPHLISPLDYRNEVHEDRSFFLFAAGAISIDANITADDLWIVGMAATTILTGRTLRARWFESGTDNFDDLPRAWYEAGRNASTDYLPTVSDGQGGGGGGTCGGAGGSPAAPAGGLANVWSLGGGTSSRPWLRPSNHLSRGGAGGFIIDTHPDGGGRISVYSNGAFLATGATLDANGRQPGASGSGGGSDSGGGGGGVVRVVSKVSITDGTYTADGGAGEDSGGGGGGGSVYLLSILFQGSRTKSASGAASGGQNGRTQEDTMIAAEITALYNSGIFDLPPHRIEG